MKWELLETATKDMAMILAYRKHDEFDLFGVAQWLPSAPDIKEGWFWAYSGKPTHWMPLPEPPKHG